MQDVQLDGNEFFFVNKAFPYGKAAMDKHTGVILGWSTEGFDVRKMFKLERGTGDYHGWYYIKSVVDTRWGNILIGNGAVHTHAHRTIADFWKFERVIDNLGNDWDYFKIISKNANHPLVFMGKDQPYLMIGPWKTGDNQLWRMIPRYKAEDEGYIQIRRHRG